MAPEPEKRKTRNASAKDKKADPAKIVDNVNDIVSQEDLQILDPAPPSVSSLPSASPSLLLLSLAGEMDTSGVLCESSATPTLSADYVYSKFGIKLCYW